MHIATNALFYFSPKEGYQLFRLGKTDVDAIILMFDNWDADNSCQIDCILRCISSYPKDVPCYIMGCEVAFDGVDTGEWSRPHLDRAVKLLCDEVLSRSKSIGVREKSTFRYLTEFLGYNNEQVDIIFEADKNAASGSVKKILEKNNKALSVFSRDILKFQEKKRRILYKPNLSVNDKLVIGIPDVSHSATSARLNANIDLNGDRKTIWCETKKNYAPFLLSERADAFLCLMLPFAMRSGQDIICEAPVTEEFLHNVNEILIPQLCAHDARLHRVKVEAQGDSSKLVSEGAVGTGMSCGVDSLYTLLLYHKSPYRSMNLTHIYVGNYAYGNESLVYNRAKRLAEYIDLPIVETKTNINEEIPLIHLHTHFFKTMFGVLALKKLFRMYYYSTAEDFSHFDLRGNATKPTSKIELLLLYCFSDSELKIITGGVKSERVDKTRALKDFEVAHKFLNVCLHPNREMNCGKCDKCIRTLLTLECVGGLEEFAEVFPLEEYRERRVEAVRFLLSHKHTSYLSQVYKYFEEYEADLIAFAKQGRG